VLLLLAAHANAQGDAWQQISLREGLPQRSVLSIYQDVFGFMWFGTRDGLCRYDGHEFVVYRHQADDEQSLVSNSISAITGDSHGNIYVATDKGLSRYDINSNTFHTYQLPATHYASSAIHEVFVSRTGVVWMGCRYGLFALEPFSGQFVKHSFMDGEALLLQHGTVSAITEDQQGQLWIGSSRLGLFCYNPLTRQGFSLSSEQDRIAFPFRIESLLVGEQGIWAGSYGAGLFLFDRSGEIRRHWHAEALAGADKLGNNLIRQLAFDRHGKLYVGTFQGLYTLADTAAISNEPLQRASSSAIRGDESVRALFRDRADNMWLGTYADGLKLKPAATARFPLQQVYDPDLRKQAMQGSVSALYGSPKNRVLIGTEDGELVLVNATGRKTYRLPEQGAIKALYTDSSGTVWMGVFGKGLYAFDPQSEQFQKYVGFVSSYVNKDKGPIINSMVQDAEGLWIGTDGMGGLHYFDLSQKRFRAFPQDKKLHDLLNHRSVKHILRGKDGRLYLATHGHGLVIYNPASGDMSQKQHFQTTARTVQVDQLNHVQQDRHGRLWLATHGQGVLSLAPNEAQAKHYHTQQGMLDNLLYGTVEDVAGTLWFIGLHGLSSLEPDGSIQQYGYAQGMPLMEINEQAFAETEGKQLMLGGREGWFVFDMADTKGASLAQQPILMTSLYIGNKSIEADDPSGLLRGALFQTRELILNHKQNSLSLGFSALSYDAQQRTSYSYRLDEGAEWIKLPSNRIAFTNLDPGAHQLHVRASFSGHAAGESIWRVQVYPAPWFSWWAKLLYGLLVLAIAWYFWNRYIQGIRLKHSLRIEQLEKEKWKEVHDVKLGYFLDVSHELRTPLSLIIAPLEELLAAENQTGWRKNRLDMMYYNTQRLRLLSEQVLQIKEIDTGVHKLDNSYIALKKLLQDMLMSFWPLAEQRAIQLLVELDGLSDHAFCLDRDKLEKVLFNLLQNAFKFTHEGGEVGFSAHSTEDAVTLIVWDTGIGIAAKDLDHIFDRFYSKDASGQGLGIGLALCKSLLSVMGGEITVRSAPAQGTKFVVRLPCLQRPVPAEPLATEMYTYQQPLITQPIAVVHQQIEPASGSTKSSILLVDDNVDILNYLASQLKEEYDLFLATDGLEGLQQAEQLEPSLIISDVMMPKLDGYALCARIKGNANLCHIPVILLTAKISQGAKMEGLALGADDYLPKPFHIFELKLRIKNFLMAQHRLHERYRKAAFLPDIADIAGNKHDEELLKRINEAITANIDNPVLNVEWIGERIGMSRVHLFRKLKALTGMAPSDYIKNYRMKYACELLKNGELRVAEVAFRVGFQDSQYFSKVFKKEMGMSPSAYLQKKL